jgi:hypothetical protein
MLRNSQTALNSEVHTERGLDNPHDDAKPAPHHARMRRGEMTAVACWADGGV